MLSFTFTTGSYQYFSFQSNGPTNGPRLVEIDGAVPEASTWAMMIAGFAMVGAGLRRRKTRIAFAV